VVLPFFDLIRNLAGSWTTTTTTREGGAKEAATTTKKDEKGNEEGRNRGGDAKEGAEAK
jgi:hypothetical protein